MKSVAATLVVDVSTMLPAVWLSTLVTVTSPPFGSSMLIATLPLVEFVAFSESAATSRLPAAPVPIPVTDVRLTVWPKTSSASSLAPPSTIAPPDRIVTTLPPLFDAATRLSTTMSPVVVSRMMSCPPVVAVVMPATGVLTSASVAPTNAELTSTSVPTVNPSASTICTLPDASARAASVTAATPNRLFVEPPAPVMPV